MARVLHLEVTPAVVETGEGPTPVDRFQLFSWGWHDTTYGRIYVDRELAEQVIERYLKRTRGRDGWLDIDFFHLSRREGASLEDRRSAGRCRLELTDDGLDVVDIRLTSEAREWLIEDKVRSYSPVIRVDRDGRLLEVVQLSLTNLPAMDDAGLLAADEHGLCSDAEASPEIHQEEPMAEELSPRLQALAERRSMGDKMKALSARVRMMLGEDAHLEDVYDDHVIACRYLGDECRYYKVSYTMGGCESAQMSSPVEVVRTYTTADQESAVRALQERHATAHEMLLALTDARTTTEALARVEAFRRDAEQRAELESRLLQLQEREYQRERAVLLDEAKRAGRWTRALEEAGDRVADMARRLHDDPVAALRAHWAAAPVVVAPGGERQAERPTVLELSEVEERTLRDAAAAMGLSLEMLRRLHIESRRRA